MASVHDFSVGEEVLVFYGHLLFAAKILKIEPEREDKKIFRIHYVGWTKRHDTWIGIDLMNKSNPDNIKYQKELEEQMRAEREARKKQKELEKLEAKRKKLALKKALREKKKKEKEAMEKKKKEEKAKKASKTATKAKVSIKKAPKKRKADTTHAPKKVTPSKKPKSPKKSVTAQKSPVAKPAHVPPFQYRQRMPIPWHWKSDLRYPKEDPKAWTPFTLEENEKIEVAFKKKQKSLKLPSGVVLDFIRVVCWSPGNRDDARSIKRGGIPMKGKKRKYVYTSQ